MPVPSSYIASQWLQNQKFNNVTRLHKKSVHSAFHRTSVAAFDRWVSNYNSCSRGFSCQCNSAAPEPGVVTDPPEANRTDETVCVTSHDINTGDGTTWLYQLDLGDWLGAFVAMEESFKTKTLNQYARYAYFTQEFVRLEQHACVADFLEMPCVIQPFDCLLAALFVRKYLPQNVWSRRQEVTWTDVLQYLPHFLASRLSDEAIAYLCTFPVFVDEVGPQEAGEDALCAVASQPSPKPGPDSVSKEPPRSSGDAHGGMKTTGTDTSKPDSEEEAPAPTESGKQHSSPVESESSGLSSSLLSDLLDYRNNPAPIGTLFQEDEDKASVKLKADERGRNEDADRTVYLDKSPEPSVSSLLRTRSSSDSIANSSTSSSRELLLSAIAKSPKWTRGLLPVTLESSYMHDYPVNTNCAPVHNSTRNNDGQAQESDGTLITMGAVTLSAGSATSDRGRDPSAPRDTSSDISNRGTRECPLTCREFAASHKIEDGICGASNAEIEHYQRRRWLSNQAPYNPRSAVTAPEQCIRSETRYASSATVCEHHWYRPRVASSPELSSALDGRVSFLPPTRGRGRGSRTSRGETPRYPGALREGSPDAVSVHVASEASFQNAEHPY